MIDRAFIDTNILVYAYSKTEPERKATALELLKAPNVVMNTQVVNEFIWVMYGKFSVPMEKLRDISIRLLQKFEIIVVNQVTIRSALDIAIKYKYSYWDSLIIASALEDNCSILYTEDMQDGQLIGDGLKIVNPFKE